MPTHINPHTLKKLVRAIIATRSDEIACGDCFEELDQFVEIALQGKDPSQAMPLVEAHLEMCTDCREEFEALLEALRAAA